MSFSLSYKPLIRHAGNTPSNDASTVASLLKCMTSLLTWSCEPSTLLCHPSVYSCCLATRDVFTSAVRSNGSGRHGAEDTFLYCCVIAAFTEALPEQICYIIPSLRLFVPNGLTVHHLSSFWGFFHFQCLPASSSFLLPAVFILQSLKYTK
jgi:hypothetical protein